MMNLLKTILFATSIFICPSTNAQKQFSVSIQFPGYINKGQIQLFYDNGQDDNILIRPDYIGNEIAFSKSYYSKYAAIIIAYKGNSARFWIWDQPAIIKFETGDSISNPLLNYKLVHALALEKNESEQKLAQYTADQQKDLDNFQATNLEWFKKDSLILLFKEKSKKLGARRVDFVKNNSNSYYSFWLFRRELIYADFNIDSLIQIYNSAFSDSLKNSFEGAEIVKRLTGRNLKKNVKAAGFTAVDVTGKTISLEDYKDKHVLLTFWASWCVPCMEEVPAIKTMRQLYPANELEIIFVTLDNDSTKFSGAVKKYDLAWIHIFNNIELLKRYGVLAIPQVYLIDPQGQIIYSREEEKDLKLELLTQLLAKRFRK